MLLFRASVFSGTFVYVLFQFLCLVVIFRGVGLIFPGCDNFLGSERVVSIFPDFDRATSVHFVIFAGCGNSLVCVRAATALAFR